MLCKTKGIRRLNRLNRLNPAIACDGTCTVTLIKPVFSAKIAFCAIKYIFFSVHMALPKSWVLRREKGNNAQLSSYIFCKQEVIAAGMYNKLTENDIQEMEKEIEHRKLVLRPQLLEEVKETRAHGDLSENFEYHAAKREKNRNESRIRFLERMIRTAKVIEDTSAEDEVGVGKTVTIYIPEDDEEETYTIVSTMRQDSIHGLISVESPMGRALLGHREGDRIRVRVSDSYSYEAQIRKISLTDAADEAKIRSF